MPGGKNIVISITKGERAAVLLFRVAPVFSLSEFTQSVIYRESQTRFKKSFFMPFKVFNIYRGAVTRHTMDKKRARLHVTVCFWSFFLLSGVCFVPPRENKHVSVNSRWWQPGLHTHTRQHASIRCRFNWEGNDGLSSPRTTWNHCQLMGMRICITQPENNCGVHVERWQQVSFLSERLFLPRSAEGLLPAHTH